MIIFLRLLLLSISLIFTTASLSAQIGFSLPFVNNAVSGSTLNLPVTVTGFDSISAVQYVIRWDPEVLRLDTISSLNLPDLVIDEDFGLGQSLDSGILRFAWTSPDLSIGTTRPDGASIFTLVFTVIGANATETALTFTELPPNTYFEVVNYTGQTVSMDEAVIDNGFVAVGFTVSAAEPGMDALNPQLAPNPFSDATRLTFELPQATRVRWTITDATGRQLLDEQEFLPAGAHSLEFDSTLLPARGTYYLLLQAGSYRRAMPLISR
jgi:hypothetical protein